MEKTFWMDGYLKSNLARAKKAIKDDWDFLFCVDGRERSGKSVVAMQCAYECDPTICIERIVFTPQEFENAVKNAKPYQAIVYDEAYTGLLASAAMSLINRTVIRMLAEIGQKNLFIFVVMPTFFDLQKYVAIWRSAALIHVYTDDEFKRGFFTFYNADKKKDLYIDGKKYYNYNAAKANFYGRFGKWYAVDEAEYRKKKARSLIDKDKVRMLTDNELKDAMFNRLAAMGEQIPNSLKMDILNMGNHAFYERLRAWKAGRSQLSSEENMENEDIET